MKILNRYVNRFQAGAVITINASWGEGKSWFGEFWNKDLEGSGYKTIFIDAFKQDYLEDPFLLIAAEFSLFLKNLKQENKTITEFIKIASTVGKILAPDLAKFAVNTLGKKLSKYKEEKASIENFCKKMRECVEQISPNHPIVIFIDELDRCRPDFAVRLLERIKHFFDIDGLVFVLLINQNQLEKSIKGIYGSEIDAANYLGKFVHLNFNLPRIYNIEKADNEDYGSIDSKFIEITFEKYNFPSEEKNLLKTCLLTFCLA